MTEKMRSTQIVLKINITDSKLCYVVVFNNILNEMFNTNMRSTQQNLWHINQMNLSIGQPVILFYYCRHNVATCAPKYSGFESPSWKPMNNQKPIWELIEDITCHNASMVTTTGNFFRIWDFLNNSWSPDVLSFSNLLKLQRNEFVSCLNQNDNVWSYLLVMIDTSLFVDLSPNMKTQPFSAY